VKSSVICLVELWFSYGETEVPIRIPDENLLGIIKENERKPAGDLEIKFSKALEKLELLINAEKKIVVIGSSSTRPSINQTMLRQIIQAFDHTKINPEKATFILGQSLFEDYNVDNVSTLSKDTEGKMKFVVHDWNSTDLVHLGKTSLRTEVYLNKNLAEADVRILITETRLHPFLGYLGGNIALSVAGIKTIQGAFSQLTSEGVGAGKLDGNPVYRDSVEITDLAKIDFALNVVADAEGNIIDVFSGAPMEAFLQSIKLVDEIYRTPVEKMGDIAVVSAGGSPYDKNLYQALDAANMVSKILKDNGIIILIAECPEGYGNNSFYDWAIKLKSINELGDEIKRRFAFGGQQAYFLANTLDRIKIILVSTMPEYYSTGVFKLNTAKTANDALRTALRRLGKTSMIWVVNNGLFTLPMLKKP